MGFPRLGLRGGLWVLPLAKKQERRGAPEIYRPISRILCPGKPGDHHLSGLAVTDKIYAAYPPAWASNPFPVETGAPVYMAFQLPGFTSAPSVTLGAVGSYPTFSPLPRCVAASWR